MDYLPKKAIVLYKAVTTKKHLHTVNTYCFATLLDHLLHSSYPEDVQSAFVRFDASIRTTAELALSTDLEGVALSSAVPKKRIRSLSVILI
jgi:hypothetical protein